MILNQFETDKFIKTRRGGWFAHAREVALSRGAESRLAALGEEEKAVKEFQACVGG
jgi:hypothetical protein